MRLAFPLFMAASNLICLFCNARLGSLCLMSLVMLAIAPPAYGMCRIERSGKSSSMVLVVSDLINGCWVERFGLVAHSAVAGWRPVLLFQIAQSNIIDSVGATRILAIDSISMHCTDSILFQTEFLPECLQLRGIYFQTVTCRLVKSSRTGILPWQSCM